MYSLCQIAVKNNRPFTSLGRFVFLEKKTLKIAEFFFFKKSDLQKKKNTYLQEQTTWSVIFSNTDSLIQKCFSPSFSEKGSYSVYLVSILKWKLNLIWNLFLLKENYLFLSKHSD